MAQLTQVHAHDTVHWFLADLCSRVVANSGIPSDTYHLGKIILQSLTEAPNFISQIDGATDESETNASVLERSIRCAIAFRKLGLVTDDIISIIAPNHVDVTIPFYGALYLGLPIAAIDINLGITEMEASFRVNKPKLILCQSEKASQVQTALNNCDVNAVVITFNKCEGFQHFRHLLDVHGGDENAVKQFKPNDFNPEETFAVIAVTSGTTGLPKGAALTHKNLRISVAYMWMPLAKFPTPTQMGVVSSPLQWLSAVFNFLFSPILRFTRLQSSKPLFNNDFYRLINKYKPTFLFLTPTLATTLFNGEDAEVCDFSCIENIYVGGSMVSQAVVDNIKRVIPQVKIMVFYGLSEVSGLAFYDSFPHKLSVGRPMGCFSYRLVDINTGKDIIDEPNVPGELWLKGPTCFKGYYNDPEATAQIFEDGWVKTGDILYRDEHWNFYFVERLKQLLKYRNNHVSPTELEGVIKQHPGVFEVAVTGIPDPVCGDLPAACVILKPGHTVTAQQIKDYVKDRLADSKQLRGGVALVTDLPLTATSKIDRKKLKDLAHCLKRE